MPTGIYDMRSFMKRLEAEGELCGVKAEVDWKFELGAIARRVFTPPTGPALLFENVKGYKTPVFTGGVLTVKRLAIALELDPETDEQTLVRECIQRLEKPVKPVLVKDGPCKENKYFGKDVNVLMFPVPWWAEGDGGRYIGTFHQVVCKDPETGWTNVGTYRMMVHEPNLLGVQAAPFQHISMINAKWREMNKPMPIAISIGNDPVAMITSGSPFPAYVNEWDMAGALRGRPFELVKAETIDLEVPAYSEIILEGEVNLDDFRREGPFGEHTGFYGAIRKPLPTIKINCITHRNNPIFRGTIVANPAITEQSRVESITGAIHGHVMYKNAGFPGIVNIRCPELSDPDFSTIISIKKSYPSHALDAGRLFISSKVGKMTKHVIVVDDDINVYDLDEVLWAINTRVQASRQIYITRYENGSRLDASVPLDFLGITDKMIIDATWSSTPDFPPREEWGGLTHPPRVVTTPELAQYIDKRWHEYGIK